MKKQVLFVILEQFADWEGAYLSSALYMLGNGQYEVKTVSLTRDMVTSIGGFGVTPDYPIDAVPSNYEALILIGGMAWRNPEAQKVRPLVAECLAQGRILAGICDASAFLATAGAFNAVRHTGNDLNDMKQWAGAAYTGEEQYVMQQAVRDKNIISANGTASLEFAKEVLMALEAAPEDKIMEWYSFHKLGYYEAPMPKGAMEWNE